MKKNIAIVTGGAGFIGSHMCDLLIKKKFEVRIIDNLSGGHIKNINHHSKTEKLKLYNYDITKIKPNNKIFKDVKFIFHFAGKGDIVPSIERPNDYILDNVIGTSNILECARNNNIKKFIYAASSSCYGLAKTPTKETNDINPMYPYALSKNMGEQLVLHWGKLYNLPVVSVRIFNAYGTRVRTTGAYGAVFGVFFKQLLMGKPFTIVGNGNQKRDFIYVTDLVDAFYKLAMSNANMEVYNVGAGIPQSINKLVNIIDSQNKIVYLPNRPGEPDTTWADISKIQNKINWKPKINFEKGIKLMLEEINNWKDAPLWDVKKINNATKTWFEYMSKF